MNLRTSRIISSILIILLPVTFKLLGVDWLGAIAIGVIMAIALLILSSSLGKKIQNFSNKIAYLLIAISVILLIIVGFPQIQTNWHKPDLVSGFVGGERYELLVRDEQVQQLLNDAGIKITEASVSKKGSISQLKTLSSIQKPLNIDFIWSGDAPIAEASREIIEAGGTKILALEATLSDPLVLVVDKSAAKVLAKQQFFGLINPQDNLAEYGFNYRVDTVTFADFLARDSTWASIGLTQYVSAPGVIMSDSSKSNGGLMAETLIATVWHNLAVNNLTGSQLFDSQSLPRFEPLPTQLTPELQDQLVRLRRNSGFAESTSSKIRTQLEEGGIPWALTYYSLGKQITENNSNFTLVVLSHTLVNSNQFLAFSEKGVKLLKVIQSPQFAIISQKYGYKAPKRKWIVLPDPQFSQVDLLERNEKF